jgi:predicted HTH transcriptional regulator
VDEAHLWSFVREFEGDAFEAGAVADYPTEDVLKRDLLLATGNMGEVVPTVAGLLLFGRDGRVAELLPRSSVTATRFAGDTTQSPKIESLTLAGNLHTLYESAMRFISRYCDLWQQRPRRFPEAEQTEQQAVVARANYHRGTINEAVANALVHRDLALPHSTTRIHIFDRSLEIINPRRTNGFAPTAQRAIRYGIHQRINPQIAAIFSSPAYGLEIPRGGLPELLRQSRLFSNRRAEIHAFNDEFRLRFYGT